MSVFLSLHKYCCEQQWVWIRLVKWSAILFITIYYFLLHHLSEGS